MIKYTPVTTRPKTAVKIIMRADNLRKKGYETWYYANKEFTKFWSVSKKKK